MAHSLRGDERYWVVLGIVLIYFQKKKNPLWLVVKKQQQNQSISC